MRLEGRLQRTVAYFAAMLSEPRYAAPNSAGCW
jgi:hypothetical protein